MADSTNQRGQCLHERVVLMDQYGGLDGGQTIFLTLIHVLLSGHRSVVTLFPHGGSLEETVERRFGGKVESRHLPDMGLSRGRKGLGDALKLTGNSLLFARWWPTLARSDAVYVNGARLFLPVFLASFGIRRRYVYHVHLDHSPAEKRLISLIARSPTTHRVIINSAFVQERLVRFDPALQANPRLVLVENGLSPGCSQLPFIDRFAGRAEPLNVAVIGRISREKGQDILLDLAPRFPAMRFFLIGRVDPGSEPFARRLCSRLPRNVSLEGETLDLTATLNRLRIQVALVPSRWEEPFGLALVESMAHSCLSIASRRGALASISERCGAWCFSTTGEVVGMLRSLLAMKPSERASVARKQHERTLAEFHFEHFREGILRAVDHRTPTPPPDLN